MTQIIFLTIFFFIWRFSFFFFRCYCTWTLGGSNWLPEVTEAWLKPDWQGTEMEISVQSGCKVIGRNICQDQDLHIKTRLVGCVVMISNT